MKRRGFTLIELLVVVAIISLLASIVMASLNTARAKARDARRMQDIHEINTAIQLYIADNGHAPFLVDYGGCEPGFLVEGDDRCITSDNDGAEGGSGMSIGYGWEILADQLNGYINPLPHNPILETGEIGGYFYADPNYLRSKYETSTQYDYWIGIDDLETTAGGKVFFGSTQFGSA